MKTETYESLASRIGIADDGSRRYCLKSTEDGTWCVVAALKDGQFAVLKADGIYARLLKILPSAERARAYNFAVAGAR
jgi:hypothetical protein